MLRARTDELISRASCSVTIGDQDSGRRAFETIWSTSSITISMPMRIDPMPMRTDATAAKSHVPGTATCKSRPRTRHAAARARGERGGWGAGRASAWRARRAALRPPQRGASLNGNPALTDAHPRGHTATVHCALATLFGAGTEARLPISWRLEHRASVLWRQLMIPMRDYDQQV